MPIFKFEVGFQYTRDKIYDLAEVPVEQQRGNWNTGYTKYRGEWFIFCHIDAAGRTGHDYGNRFVGDLLEWYGKTSSTLGQPSIQSMIDPDTPVHIFSRNSDRGPFTYLGIGIAVSTEDVSPVRIRWRLKDPNAVVSADPAEDTVFSSPDEVGNLWEGSSKQVTVNAYERNQQARRECIGHYGSACSVCGFDFRVVYGQVGSGYIHVHHIKPISQVNAEYKIDPVADLRPVCPNCHSMLHKKWPEPYSIAELRSIMAQAERDN